MITLTLLQLLCMMVGYVSNMFECLLILEGQEILQLPSIFLDNNERLSGYDS